MSLINCPKCGYEYYRIKSGPSHLDAKCPHCKSVVRHPDEIDQLEDCIDQMGDCIFELFEDGRDYACFPQSQTKNLNHKSPSAQASYTNPRETLKKRTSKALESSPKGSLLSPFPKLLLIPLAALAVIAIWFGFHDSWDIDNYSEISSKCQAVIDAAANFDDAEATRAYHELVEFIGENDINHDFITEKISDAQHAKSQCELEATQAKKSGRKAFLKGVQLRQSPIKHRDAWIIGWNEAKGAKENRNEGKRQRRAKQLRLANMKSAWLAGEAKTRERGYYGSTKYLYDLETLQICNGRMQLSTSPEEKKLHLKLIESQFYEMERDKYATMGGFLETHGVRTENQWLDLYEKSCEFGWEVNK